MKRYMVMCMMVLSVGNLSAMTGDARVRTKSLDETREALTKKFEETRKLIEFYKAIPIQDRARMSTGFLRSIEENVNFLEAAYRDIDDSQKTVKDDLQAKIRTLREALDKKASSQEERKSERASKTRQGNDNEKDPKKDCWECLKRFFGRRDVTFAAGAASGVLFGYRKWGRR